MIRLKLLSLASLICVVLAPAVASADDFAPPPWSRLHPGAVTAEWEFLTPANPAPPDGPLTDLSRGGGTVPGGTHVDIFGPSGWGGTSGGNWFFPPTTEPQGMRFWIDNVIDFEPDKHIRLQVTHTPGLGLFVDPLVDFNVAATGSTPTLPLIITGTDPLHTLFVWDMHPNPPWESFVLHVTSPGEIRQIVVDTISTGIPEPSTFIVYGAVALCLGLVVRMCPRLWKQCSVNAPGGWRVLPG